MTGKEFIYKNIRLNDERTNILFDYQIITDEKSYDLSESFKFPFPLTDCIETNKLLKALHVALGISYYKAFMPPTISHGYEINANEADFWNNVFLNGLGEFLLVNNLASTRIAKFLPQEGSINIVGSKKDDWRDSALLGIGGGKDSIVAGELLKQAKIKTTGFVLATADNQGQTQEVSSVMGLNLLCVERRIDKQILEINKLPGAFNGHIPISLVFALTGCLLAVTTGDKFVVVANEASASIPQTTNEQMNVNHQWSKSLEFERLFQKFIEDNISKNLIYTSIIRPLSSVAIAKLFSKMNQYFGIFTSDNSVLKMSYDVKNKTRWSKYSSKSLSSYILLSPWIDDLNLDRIFEHEFLNDDGLSEMFLGLLGAGVKPILDCVGTPEELRLSLSLLYRQGRKCDSTLVKLAIDKGLIIDNTEAKLSELLAISLNHTMPEKLFNLLNPILEEGLSK